MHEPFVTEHMSQVTANFLLGRSLTPIADSESSLPRKSESTWPDYDVDTTNHSSAVIV